jgi:glycerophosphoryl diester phosphodiesterase
LAVAKPHRVNLELKRPRRDRTTGLADRVCRILQHTNSVGRVLVSSFDADLIARAKLKLPRLAIALISKRAPAQAIRRAAELGCSSWHPHRTLIRPSLIKRAHAAGMRVHAWTVDRPQDAKRLVRMGVDGVFTNTPDRIRKVFAR